jgi:hypothetical protein
MLYRVRSSRCMRELPHGLMFTHTDRLNADLLEFDG